MNFLPPKCAPKLLTMHLKCAVGKKGLQLVKQCCKVPKMQNLSVLSDLECFLRSWDAMQGVEVQIRVLKPRMKHLITKCALKLPTASMKCAVGKTGLQLVKEVKT